MSLAGPKIPDDSGTADTPTTTSSPRQGRERLSAVGSVPEPDDVAGAVDEDVDEATAAEPPSSDQRVRPIRLENNVVQAEVGIQRIEELRPVPPATRSGVPISAGAGTAAPPEPPVDVLPVYDPFSARRRRAPEWLVHYTASLVVLDLLAAVLGVLIATHVRVTGSQPVRLVDVAVVVLWPALLALLGTYAERRLGTGFDEYRRVFDAALLALGGLGFVAALRPGVGLGRLLVVGVPVAAVGSVLSHVANRRRMHGCRRMGLMTKRVVLVGAEVGVLDLMHRIRRDPCAGLRVVAACLPRPPLGGELSEEGLPFLGGLDDVVRVVDEVRADSVLVAAATETAGSYLRDLAWRLEGTKVELLVGPGVIEVSPNRLQVRPTTSMPLIQILEPEFRGGRRLVKELVDRISAAVLLVLGLPFLALIALAIKLDDRGPVLYRHRRIGKQGCEFDVLKFRSMVHGAERQLQELMALNEGNEVQFKLREDPRVTRVGRFLRRYSLDELPQLINVLKGDMSLVGPRPHVTREVEQYGPDMHRRLLVKPGITGLWQVNGRSNLSWEEAVELDVRYVENWSIGLDVIILLQTLRVVMSKIGAY